MSTAKARLAIKLAAVRQDVPVEKLLEQQKRQRKMEEYVEKKKESTDMEYIHPIYKEVVRETQTEAERYRATLLLGKACGPNKAKNLDNNDPRGCYISEKLDGYRIRWDRSHMRLSGGDPVLIPEWLFKVLPREYCLDGEVWMGYGEFESMGFLRSQVMNEAAWLKSKYCVFNIPIQGTRWKDNFKMLREIVEDCKCRWYRIRKEYGLNIPCPIVLVEQKRCKSKEQMMEMYQDILNQGGEGLMCVDPNMEYQPGKRIGMWKVKPLHDAEAKIIGYNICSTNRKKLGGFQVEAIGDGLVPRGTVFDIACDFMHENSRMQSNWNYKRGKHDIYKIGDKVTYKFMEVQKSGKPRFPKLKGIRMEE